MENAKLAYFSLRYLDILPNCAKRGLSSTMSTVFNAKILVLLTIGVSHVQTKVDIGKHQKIHSLRFEHTSLKVKLRMLSTIMSIGQRFPTFPEGVVFFSLEKLLLGISKESWAE